jgi:hypothetical protein
VVTGGQLASAATWQLLGVFGEPKGLLLVAQVFSYLVFLGIASLICAVVQQDSVAGVAQDWLIRPIPRGMVLREKLLFVLVCVHVPMLVVDVSHGLAAGSTVGQAMAAALLRTGCVMLAFDLPVMALASMTKTLVQVIAGFLAVWLLVVIIVAVGIAARGGQAPVFAATGMQWMTPAFWAAVAMAAASMILPLQYFRRAVRLARAVSVGAAVLAALLSFVPWSWAFSAQQWFSGSSAASESVRLAFDGGAARALAEPGAVSSNSIRLPIEVSGLAADSMVLNDRAEIRIVNSGGMELYRGRTVGQMGYGDDFRVRAEKGETVRTYQRVDLPDKVFALIRDQPVRIEIDYSLSLLQVDGEVTMTALAGSTYSDKFGACRAKLDPDGDSVEFGCFRAGGAEACIGATLENSLTGIRNPETPLCSPDYAPFAVHVIPDAVGRIAGEVRFRDPLGLAKYPVDGSQLGDARVRLMSFRPAGHFRRQLVASGIRLSDWTATPQVNGRPQQAVD